MSLIPSLHSTIGAVLIGFTISTFLLGISTTQLYLYFINFPDDRLWLKTLVWTVWLLELTHFVAIAYSVYDMLVSNFGNILRLIHVPVGLHISSFAGVLVSTIVKGFFIFRIWGLSKSFLLVGFLSTLALCAAAAYLAANTYGIIQDNALLFAKNYGWLLYTCSGFSAGCDLAISFSLVWLLRSQLASTTRRPGMNKIVEKVTAWTLETGLLTSTFAIGLAVSVGINARNLIWLAFWFCLCRCYANSMLAALNGRKVLRSIDNKFESIPLPPTSFGLAQSSSLSTDLKDESTKKQPQSDGGICFKTEAVAVSNDTLDFRRNPMLTRGQDGDNLDQ